MPLSARALSLLATSAVGSPLKKMYSDYVSDYTQRQLVSFDRLDLPGLCAVPEATIDTTTMREGTGALRWVLSKETDGLQKMCWAGSEQFRLDVTDRKRTTLKLWLFVDTTDGIVCDHDSIYGVQAGQATFFFRVLNQNGGEYGWNHTLTGDGWHEVELSFNIHNGYTPTFDMHHITGFYLMFAGHAGTVVELDDLRVVEYKTDHLPAPAPENGRLISACEYDALDGVIVQEWYGAAYDTIDKMQGKSSLRCIGDATVNDFRSIIANLSVPITYDEDVLVIWAKIKDLSTVRAIFIELNQVQDSHEISLEITLDKLKMYGFGGKNDTWYEIRIPLSAFRVQLAEGMGDTIRLCNFRFAGSAAGKDGYDYHIDHIYLAEK